MAAVACCLEFLLGLPLITQVSPWLTPVQNPEGTGCYIGLLPRIPAWPTSYYTGKSLVNTCSEPRGYRLLQWLAA